MIPDAPNPYFGTSLWAALNGARNRGINMSARHESKHAAGRTPGRVDRAAEKREFRRRKADRQRTRRLQ